MLVTVIAVFILLSLTVVSAGYLVVTSDVNKHPDLVKFRESKSRLVLWDGFRKFRKRNPHGLLLALAGNPHLSRGQFRLVLKLSAVLDSEFERVQVREGLIGNPNCSAQVLTFLGNCFDQRGSRLVTYRETAAGHPNTPEEVKVMWALEGVEV